MTVEECFVPRGDLLAEIRDVGKAACRLALTDDPMPQETWYGGDYIAQVGIKGITWNEGCPRLLEHLTEYVVLHPDASEVERRQAMLVRSAA